MTSVVRPPLFDQLVGRLADDLEASARAESDADRARYRLDPLAWCDEQLSVPPETLRWSLLPEYRAHAWDGTRDPLATAFDALATGTRRVGVESGIGTGKTFWLMLLVKWFLSCWRPAVVVTLAPKEKQLKLHLWKEIRKRWTRFHRIWPRAKLDDLRLRMEPFNDAWAAHGFAVGVGADEESATKAQGFHEEHALFLFEETPGVNPATMEAILNTAVDEHNLVVAVGNPDHELDPLHLFCTQTPGALHVRISAFDHPNVVTGRRIVPGAVTRQSIDEKRIRFHGEDAPLFRSRVRGIAKTEAADSLVRLSWLYRARDRGRALLATLFPDDPEATLARLWELQDVPGLADARRAMGVDVANSKDGDLGAWAKGRGAVLCSVEDFPCPNANELGGRVAVEMKRWQMTGDRTGVDGVGVGAGTVNELLARGIACANIQGSAAPLLDVPNLGEERFKNLRAQLHWLFREDAANDRLILPDDEELFRDLTIPRWEPRGGVIYVQPKEAIRKSLGRSPNKGDAAIYWNFVRQVSLGTSGGGDLIDL